MKRSIRSVIVSVRPFVAVFATLLAAAATPAVASDVGYVGLRGGSGAGTDDTAGHGRHFELFAGYRIRPGFALELALSERKARESLSYPYIDPAFIEIIRKGTVRGIQLLARFDLPLGERWSVHARGGIAHFDTSMRTAIPDLQSPAGELGDAGPGLVAAIGIDYHLDADWRIGIDVQQAAGDFRLSCSGDPARCRFDRGGHVAAATATVTYAF